MDVYFAALKYESVEQVEGYGILNFLSKYAPCTPVMQKMFPFDDSIM